MREEESIERLMAGVEGRKVRKTSEGFSRFPEIENFESQEAVGDSPIEQSSPGRWAVGDSPSENIVEGSDKGSQLDLDHFDAEGGEGRGRRMKKEALGGPMHVEETSQTQAEKKPQQV